MFKCLCSFVAALAIAPPTSWAADVQREADYGQIPLSFEANQGQTDAQVKYVARGGSYALFLTPDGAVVRLASPTGHRARGAVVRMRMIGASHKALIQPEEPSTARSNYFIGPDPAKWHTGVPHFARVRYRDVYPGIDVVYYGNQRQLEYDIVVAPAADPTLLQFAVEGARRLRVDAGGNLVISTAAGDLIQHRPRVYQAIGGREVPIGGRYRVTRGKFVSFAVNSYDKRQPLVIDPALSYATYLGGSGTDTVSALTVDSSGSAYVAGATTSIDFPTTAGAYNQQCGTDANCNSGNADIFLAKLNPTGTALVYSTYIGGSASQGASQVMLDASGNAYLRGQTSSSDFPITPGAYDSNHPASMNLPFLLKVDPTGSQLLYSTYLPIWTVTAAALGPGGSVFFVGASPLLPQTAATPGAFQTAYHQTYVASLNASGTALNFATYLGGSGQDYSTSIAVDPQGNAIVTGYTTSLDFPVTLGSYQPAFPTGASSSGFVAKLNATGTALVFGTYTTGSSNTPPASIVLDSSQDIYVASSAGVWELSANGNSLLLSATGQSSGQLFIDGSDHVFLVAPGLQQVQKVTSSGIVPAFSTSLPIQCCLWNPPPPAAIDPSGNIYFAWSIGSTNRLTTPGALQPAAHGVSNAFVAKITPGGGSLRAFPSSIAAILPVNSSTNTFSASTAAWVFSDGSPYGVDVPFTAASDSTWLTVGNPCCSVAAAEPENRLDASGPIIYTQVSSSSTKGTLTGNVIVTSPGASNSPLNIPVSLKVTDQPFAAFSAYPLAFQYTIGGSAPAAQTASIWTPNGNANFTVTPSAPWLSASPSSGSYSTNLSVTVNPTGLAVGSYLGTVDLTSTGMPTVSLPVRLIVTTPQLAVSPATAAFTQTEGGASPAAQNLNISGLTGSYSATVTGGGAWLNASPLSGAMPAQMSVSVSGSGLQAGTYRAVIAISATGANTINVPVTFVVVPPNTLTLSTSSLAFSYWPGATPAAQTVSIGSDPAVNWTAFASSTGNWLSVDPTGGSTPGILSVSVNATSLAVSNYTGSISVVAPGTANSPQTISVTLAVTASQPASVTPTTLTFSTGPGSMPAPQTLALASGSGKSFTAVASSTGNWLSVSPTSGSMPGSISVSVNPGSLGIGQYSGSIAISITQQDNSVVALTVPVTLNIVAPNPMTVSPSTISVTYWPGASIPQQQINVSMTTAAPWSCTASVGWLNCPWGYGSGSFGFYPSPSSLAPGQYTGTMTFSSTETSNGPQTVTVNLTVLSAAPVMATPTSLNFKYYPGGPAPASQTFSITAGSATAFTVSTAANGCTGSGTINWLFVTPTTGTTPASLTVSADPTGLNQGYYCSTITLSFASGTVSVYVTFTIGPQLSASVASVSMTAPVDGAAQTSSAITVTSTTPGIQFQVNPGAAGNWLSVTPGAGAAPGSFYVTANPGGLAAGVYTGQVNIFATGAINNISIPVSFVVTGPASPTLTFYPAALSFTYQMNGTLPAAQMISASTSVPAVVAASVTTGSWLTVTPGLAQAPTTFNVSVSLTGLSAGVYAGFVTFTANGSQQNLPVTLTVQPAPQLSLSASSLSFAAMPGGGNPPAQSVQVTSNGTALSFQVLSSANWLKAVATTSQTPGAISVSVDATKLTAGTYSGAVAISASGAASQTIGVSLTVSALPLLTVSPAEINVTYVADGDIPFPQPLVVFSGTQLAYTLQVTSNGWLSVNHSSGTAPDLLQASVNPAGLTPGIYQGSIRVTASGASNSPQDIVVKLTVNAAPPLIYPGGVVNAASLLYGAIAPGELIMIFGENFTQTSQSATRTPWPNSLAGISVTVNGIAASLLAVTPGQIKAQIPFGVANGMTRIVVTAGQQASTPEMLPIAPVAPGTFYSAESNTALQNADFSTNSQTNPASFKDVVIAYLTGQGALNQNLAAGTPSPGDPPLYPVLPVSAIIDGDATATVLFAGMAPGQVGVMQVNLVVPKLPDGEHMLKITVGGVETNSVPIFVAGRSK
jgi:uncharacterized protein (TIGR03437 family)